VTAQTTELVRNIHGPAIRPTVMDAVLADPAQFIVDKLSVQVPSPFKKASG